MKQKAIVKSIIGHDAMVEVTRSSMCDGCANQNCQNHTCAAGSLLGAAKTMTVRAQNPIDAAIGDIVWVETADQRVLTNAALVFLMPLAACAILYGIAHVLFATLWVSTLAAGIGFAGAFAVLGVLEQKKKKAAPDIVITAWYTAPGDDSMTELPDTTEF